MSEEQKKHVESLKLKASIAKSKDYNLNKKHYERTLREQRNYANTLSWAIGQGMPYRNALTVADQLYPRVREAANAPTEAQQAQEEYEREKQNLEYAPGEKGQKKAMRDLAKASGLPTGQYKTSGREYCVSCGRKHNIGSNQWKLHLKK
jgi:hypothetical protein